MAGELTSDFTVEQWAAVGARHPSELTAHETLAAFDALLRDPNPAACKLVRNIGYSLVARMIAARSALNSKL
jgi:hypothetical protein